MLGAATRAHGRAVAEDRSSLARNGKPGGQWADHRKVVNGVLFRARTGVPWPDLPERYGPWQTVSSVIAAGRPSAPGRPSWKSCRSKRMPVTQTKPTPVKPPARSGRSTSTRPPAGRISMRPGRPARLRPTTRKRGGTREEGDGCEALGRSRGGLTSKVHLLSDDRARPLHWLTSPGQRGDSLMFAPVLDGLRIRRRGPGRPRSRPDRVRGDKTPHVAIRLRRCPTWSV